MKSKQVQKEYDLPYAQQYLTVVRIHEHCALHSSVLTNSQLYHNFPVLSPQFADLLLFTHRS